MIFRNIKNITLIITGLSWLFVLSTFLFPVYAFSEEFWGVMILAMSGLSCLSILLFLITISINKKIWSAIALKKAIAFLGIIFMSAITAIIAFIVMFIIAMNRHPVSMSTYGTPLFRPKIKK